MLFSLFCFFVFFCADCDNNWQSVVSNTWSNYSIYFQLWIHAQNDYITTVGHLFFTFVVCARIDCGATWRKTSSRHTIPNLWANSILFHFVDVVVVIFFFYNSFWRDLFSVFRKKEIRESKEKARKKHARHQSKEMITKRNLHTWQLFTMLFVCDTFSDWIVLWRKRNKSFRIPIEGSHFLFLFFLFGSFIWETEHEKVFWVNRLDRLNCVLRSMRMKCELNIAAKKGKIIENIMLDQIFFYLSSFNHEFKHIVQFFFVTFTHHRKLERNEEKTNWIKEASTSSSRTIVTTTQQQQLQQVSLSVWVYIY